MIALKTSKTLGLALLFASASNLALAQEADTAPQLRRKTIQADHYAATGINTGAFRISPKFQINGFVTSNAGNAPSNPKRDFGIELKPSLDFASDWSRHKWTGSVSADLVRFANNPDFATEAGAAETALRLDIYHDTKADFAASYRLTSLGAGNSSLPATATGTRHDQNGKISAGLTHDFGGLEGSIKSTLERSVYGNVALSGGGNQDNSDQNYWSPSLTLRAALLDRGSALNPFAEITYQPRFHDSATDRNGLKRNSQGLNFTAGVAITRGPIWEGDIALTYLVRKFADSSLKTANTLGATGNLTWQPTELTTFNATTTVSQDETSTLGVSATSTWSANLNATHSLRENIDVMAGLGLAVQSSGNSYDVTNTANLGLNWKVNPNMTAGLTYTGTWFKGAAAASDYNEQRIMTSIVLQR